MFFTVNTGLKTTCSDDGSRSQLTYAVVGSRTCWTTPMSFQLFSCFSSLHQFKVNSQRFPIQQFLVSQKKICHKRYPVSDNFLQIPKPDVLRQFGGFPFEKNRLPKNWPEIMGCVEPWISGSFWPRIISFFTSGTLKSMHQHMDIYNIYIYIDKYLHTYLIPLPLIPKVHHQDTNTNSLGPPKCPRNLMILSIGESWSALFGGPGLCLLQDHFSKGVIPAGMNSKPLGSAWDHIPNFEASRAHSTNPHFPTSTLGDFVLKHDLIDSNQ